MAWCFSGSSNLPWIHSGIADGEYQHINEKPVKALVAEFLKFYESGQDSTPSEIEIRSTAVFGERCLYSRLQFTKVGWNETAIKCQVEIESREANVLHDNAVCTALKLRDDGKYFTDEVVVRVHSLRKKGCKLEIHLMEYSIATVRGWWLTSGSMHSCWHHIVEVDVA
jgi:hypothetical protein